MKNFYGTFSRLLVLGFGFFACFNVVNAATLTVDGVGTAPSTYATIQSAIDAAVDGDTVYVELGTYAEALLINKPLTLEGQSKNGVIIDASVGSDYGIQVTADDVTLTKFTLQNAPTYGVKVAKCSDCGYVENFNAAGIHVKDSGRSNIDLNGVQNSRIGASQFTGTPWGVGVALQNVNNTTVKNVQTSGNARGGIAIYTTDKSGYPTDAGSAGIRILEVSGDEEVELYTQETDGTLEAPEAEQFICTVTSEDTNVRPDIADYVFYFKEIPDAIAHAESINGVANCEGLDKLSPILECVYPENDGSYTAYFGYENKSNFSFEIPVGEDNKLAPATFNGLQVTEFGTGEVVPGRPGRTDFYPNAAFSVNFDGGNVVWTLTGPDGSTRTATAGTNGPICPEMCGDGRVNTDEQCDDGNLEDGDGCDSSCEIESLPVANAVQCADGSVYARIVSDFDGTVMVGPFMAQTNQWFVVSDNGGVVEYPQATVSDEGGIFVSQDASGLLTVRHYGNTAGTIITFDGSIEFMNALNVGATQETGDFKFETSGQYIDSLQVNDESIDTVMIISTGNDGFTATYEVGTEQTLDCPADPLPEVVVECRDGSIYGVFNGNSSLPIYIGNFALVPGQYFELFDGTDFVVYESDIEEAGVVIEQDASGSLSVLVYHAEDDSNQEITGTIELVHGELVSLDDIGGDFALESNDFAVLDSNGVATLELRVTTGDDGVSMTYQDTNGVTVCEGDIIPVSCDEIGYGTLRYEGFERSFLLSEGIQTDEVEIGAMNGGEIFVEVQDDLGDFSFEVEFTNTYGISYSTPQIGGDGLEDESQGSNHTDVIVISENAMSFDGFTGTRKDQFSVSVEDDPRCIATIPFENVAYPVCGDGNVYARIVSETTGTYSLGNYQANYGDWFPVFEYGYPVVYSSDINYGLVVAHTTPGMLEVSLLNDEVTQERLTFNGMLEFSNGAAVSFDSLSGGNIDNNDTVEIIDGSVYFDLRVTTGDDKVGVEFIEDQDTCLEELVCDGNQYGILRYSSVIRQVIDFEKIIPVGKNMDSIELTPYPYVFDGIYAIFDLSEGYDDGTVVVTQNESGEVMFTLNQNAGRIIGGLELVNIDIVELNYLMGGDGLEFGESFNETDETDVDGNLMMFNLYTSTGIDVITIETSTEGVCEEGEEIDVCPEGDFSGSTTDGLCDEPEQETPPSSSGGKSSSVGGSSSAPTTPSLLLETGTDEEEGDGTAETLEEIIQSIDVTTIPACNEDTYIIDRFTRLSLMPEYMLNEVPVRYKKQVNARIVNQIKAFVENLSQLDTEQRNQLVRTVVCKIEIMKEARNLRHENIGAMSNGNALDYLLQFIQDHVILQFDVNASQDQEGDVVVG